MRRRCTGTRSISPPPGASSTPARAPLPLPPRPLFYPSPPPPQITVDDSVAMGKNTVGGVAGHWNYDVAGEVAHLKRFELHLDKWERVLKDREDALNRREREVEDAVVGQEREVAYLKRLELHLQNWQQFLEDREEGLNLREQEVEEALSRRDREVVEALGPLLEQLDRKKNDDTCDWELGVVAMNIVANVLVSLHHMRTLLPRGYFTAIVLTLAVLWVPSSVFLSNKVSGRYRSRRKFSYHVARLISLCFSIVVVYVLYLLSAV